MKHRIGPGEIASMVNELFSSMLEMPFNPEPQDSTDVSAREVQATIRISGDWDAECHVLVSDELAARIASDMFRAPSSELTNEEILDALGEVVNVIGGNAKGMVDLDCDLSDSRTSNSTTELCFLRSTFEVGSKRLCQPARSASE